MKHGRIVAFLIEVVVGTWHRLRAVPVGALHFIRRFLGATLGAPMTHNQHYEQLQALRDSGRPLTMEDVNRVVVPLLITRGRDIQRIWTRSLLLYGFLIGIVCLGAWAMQNLIEARAQSSRVNCVLLSNLIIQSGADGSPTLAGEVQSLYRTEVEQGMTRRQLQRLRVLQNEQRRTNTQLQVPDCKRIVRDPESVRLIMPTRLPPSGRRNP